LNFHLRHRSYFVVTPRIKFARFILSSFLFAGYVSCQLLASVCILQIRNTYDNIILVLA
jgi:hypothetical protein